MLKQTPKRRVLFVHRFTPVLLAVFGVFSLVFIQLHTTPVASATAANTVNFQARLQSAAGAIVPDGTYNIEFKLYSGDSCRPASGSGCTTEWTEDYLNSGGKGLSTINGYLSANLGSVSAFPSTINWDQQLWLSMDVGGTTSGSVTWDGAMLPYMNLTSVPSAFSANQLANTTASGRSTLTFQGSSNGDQNFIIQDQGAAGTYDLLTSTQANTGYTQLQATPGTPQSGSINISGMATADTIQGTTAVQTASIRPITDSTTAVQFQNASGSVTVMDVDTTNDRIGIGNTAPTASLDITGPTSDSSTIALNIENSAGGSIINARDDGQVTIGTTAASGTVTTFGSMTNTTHDYGDNNFFASTKFTTGTHNGTLTSISIYIGGIDPNPANDKYRLAIYTDGGSNHPTTLIAQSAEGTLTANTVNTLSVTASLTANTNYWLAYQTTTTTDSSYNDFYFASAGTNQYYAYANPYGPFPSTADTGGSNGSVAMAVYGTYTEAGTGTVPALTVAASGDIGIGNASPIYALDVSGTGNFTSSILSPQLDNAGTLGIGTGNATNITVGSTTSSSTLTLGQSTNANTVNIGNGAVTATQTINIGTAATGGAGADVVSIGSYSNDSSTTIKGGLGNITLETDNSSSSVSVVSNVDSTNAFQIQNASSATLLNFSTSEGTLTTYGGSLNVNGIANPTAPSLSSSSGGGSLPAGTYYYRLDALATDTSSTTAGIPSSPGSVITSGTTSQNTLSWTAVANATGYDIYRSTDGNNWFVNTVSSATTSIVDNGTNFTWATGGSFANFSNAGGINLQKGTGVTFDAGSAGTYQMEIFDNVNASDTLTVGNYNSGGAVDIQSSTFYLTDTSTFNHDLTMASTGAITLKNNTNSGSAFAVVDSNAVNMFNVDTSADQITIGPSGGSNTIGEILVLGNKKTSGDPTEVDGAMYYNSNARSFRCGFSGAWHSCIGGLLTANTNLTGDTVANTTSETNFGSNWSMPASYCVAGRVLRVTAQGTWQNNNSTPTLQLKLKAGTTVLGASPVITTTAQTLGTPREWRVDFQVICDATPGSSAAVEGQGQMTMWSGNANTGLLQEMANTGTVSVATNAAQTIQLSATWGTANTNNTITLRQIIVEGLGP